jgi:integrase
MKEAGLVRQTDAEDEKAQNLYTRYSLRHFYASMLIAENKDLKTLQERLGHVDAAMTLKRVWAPHQRATGEGARGRWRNSRPRSLLKTG